MASSRDSKGEREEVSPDIEQEFSRFLDDAVPSAIDQRVAVAFLRHVAECEGCARRLQERPLHAELLIEASRSGEPVDASEDDVVRADQEDAARAGAVVLKDLELTGIERRELDRDLAEDYRAQLWTLQGPAALMRAALAASELSLAISGFLSSERGMRLEGRLHPGGFDFRSRRRPRTVPRGYFAARMSDHADLSMGLSERMWDGFVRGVSRELVRLPNLHAQARGEDAVLSLSGPQIVARPLEREALQIEAQEEEPAYNTLKR